MKPILDSTAINFADLNRCKSQISLDVSVLLIHGVFWQEIMEIFFKQYNLKPIK